MELAFNRDHLAALGRGCQMVFLVILTALTCHGSDPVQFYLDLTTPLPESAAGMGVPGTVIFGSTHSGLRRLAPTLPLEVTIQDL